jgi:hypothetical protein
MGRGIGLWSLSMARWTRCRLEGLGMLVLIGLVREEIEGLDCVVVARLLYRR